MAVATENKKRGRPRKSPGRPKKEPEVTNDDMKKRQEVLFDATMAVWKLLRWAILDNDATAIRVGKRFTECEDKVLAAFRLFNDKKDDAAKKS